MGLHGLLQGYLYLFYLTLKMEATYSYETSVAFQQTTQRYIPEDRTLHNHRCDNNNLRIELVFSGFMASSLPSTRTASHSGIMTSRLISLFALDVDERATALVLWTKDAGSVWQYRRDVNDKQNDEGRFLIRRGCTSPPGCSFCSKGYMTVCSSP
jgi:hypothetical protein